MTGTDFKLKSNDNFSAYCLFQQPWWLDVVVPGAGRVLEVKRGDYVRARLPYYYKRGPLGLRMITMPPLTPYLGPWLAPSDAKYAKQLGLQKDLLNELIRQLPPHDFFLQYFHYEVSNWLPFYWCGFSATVRYTYVIENLQDLDQVWRGFLENVRTDIRKAEKHLIVRTDLDIERFLDVNELTFRRQKKKLPYSRHLVRRLDRACQDRGVRRIFFAEDAKGRIHSAVYLVWDESSAYYLMGGADPELRGGGATSFLIWHAIQHAATVTKKFDFEGSMLEPVERFFRAFGAIQKPYFQVSRANLWGKFCQAGAQVLKYLRKR